MNRQQAIKTLSANRNALNRFSVKDIYIFGSVALDESSDASDVDILVQFWHLPEIRQEYPHH